MKELTITIPLSTFLHSHLGYDPNNKGPQWEKRTIDPFTAGLIEMKMQEMLPNDRPCYIQYKDDISPDLTQPVLWRADAWNVCAERHYRLKALRDKNERLRHIEQENVRIFFKAFCQYTGMDMGEQGKVMCFRMVREKKWKIVDFWDESGQLGKQLITKED